MIDAVILAGGKSSRMGEDKALLPFRGYNSLAKYQYERLKKLFPRVYISTKEPKFDFEAPLLFDKSSEISSPLIALQSILEQLQKPIFLIAVDMPFVPLSEIQKLLALYQKKPNFDAYIFKSPHGLEPTCAIYTPKTLHTISHMIDQKLHKMNIFLSKINISMVQSKHEKYFTNLNYKEEYQKALFI